MRTRMDYSLSHFGSEENVQIQEIEKDAARKLNELERLETLVLSR